MIASKRKLKWIQWWLTPPDSDAALFTNIRKAVQSLHTCKHVWVHHYRNVHDKQHPNTTERHCLYCNKQQKQIYHNNGAVHTEWVSIAPHKKSTIMNTSIIKPIQQECGQSCGIACVAMVTNKTFKEVRAQTVSVPIQHRELDRLLAVNNKKAVRSIYNDLLPDKVYIAAVPSLNKGGGMHYVVLDTRPDKMVIHDPNAGITDKQTYDIGLLRSWGVLIEVCEI